MAVQARGDVIITTHSPTGYLLIRQGGSASIPHASVRDAIRAAVDVAKDVGVNVWFLDDEVGYQLVAEYRESEAERTRL